MMKYLWETTKRLGLKLHIHIFWTLTSKFENDVNKIEKAHKEEEVNNSKWPLLYHINMCRMHVRAFTIGGYLMKNRTHIHLPYLDGTERGVNKDILIPDARHPTRNQWLIWKSFIFRMF